MLEEDPGKLKPFFSGRHELKEIFKKLGNSRIQNVMFSTGYLEMPISINPIV
jgi:hypothetical protein